MNRSQQILLDRLLTFQIDQPGTKLTFARRLARENGWSLAYAERVIVEYKMFLFLAAISFLRKMLQFLGPRRYWLRSDLVRSCGLQLAPERIL